MSALTKSIFKGLAAPVFAAGVMASSVVPFTMANAQTAQAQPVAANANAREVVFQTLDGRTNSVRGVQAAAAEASAHKIAIVVWGGNHELQQEAYNAALDLRDQGIPLAIILGPRLIPSDNVASYQVYAQGVPVFDGNGASFGTDHVADVRPTVLRMGRTAFRDHFPTQVAALAMN